MSATPPNVTSSQIEAAEILLGTVVAVQANYYWVRLNVAPVLPPEAHVTNTLPPGTLLCTRRTRLKKIGQQVMVGDRVQVEEPDWVDGRGVISQVLPRQTELDRPPIANANQILLVFALAEPPIEPLQLSRFLVKAESTQLSVELCLSKADLASCIERQKWGDRLQEWGYQPLIISTKTQSGLAAIQTHLTEKITVISGPSGVGKSSLINRLIPAADLRVGAVSGKLGRGRHTTRHVELFELLTDGLLADTPGFNQPDLVCDPIDLAHYFPEARSRLEQNFCQFADCLHRDEPNCAVRGDWERYQHYLIFLEEVMARQAALDRVRDTESTTKLKSGGEGQDQYEPKLETKKYRRPSRRTQRQELQDLYLEGMAEADSDRDPD